MNNVTKNEFRQNSLKILKKQRKFGRLKKDKFIIEKIYKIIKKEQVKNILLYIPLSMEVDMLYLINKLRRERKYNIFVPFMVGKSLKIVPYRLPLQKKQYGILEPKNSNMITSNIDLAVVPIVATDKTKRRIGFGVGFYDRYFDSLKYKPITIFTQRVLCQIDSVLTEPHDIKGDYIVTHKGII